MLSDKYLRKNSKAHRRCFFSAPTSSVSGSSKWLSQIWAQILGEMPKNCFHRRRKAISPRLRAFSLFIIAKPFDRNSSSVFDISGPLARLEDRGAAALLSAMVVYSIYGVASLLQKKGESRRNTPRRATVCVDFGRLSAQRGEYTRSESCLGNY